MKQTPHDQAEWLEHISDDIFEYHRRQFDETYRSTTFMMDLLEELGIIDQNGSQKIADLGAGLGANLHRLSSRWPNAMLTGIELNEQLVQKGNEVLREKGSNNCHLEQGDLYELKDHHRNTYDGVISFQTLSWLPDHETPIRKMAEMNPSWIAMSSLFFDGDVNTVVKTFDYSDLSEGQEYRQSYYNVYALPLIQKCFAKHGYTKFEYKWFNIDIDLPKPEGRGMGSYTELLADGRRLQFSGPMFMNWYFVVAVKE